MAKGSEHFTWKLFEGVPRRCRVCGKEPLKIADVGEHRTLRPSGKTDLLCRQCQQENVNARIRENRERMGMQR